MRNAEAVTFAGAALDRSSQLRGDAAAQAALAADQRALGLAVWRGKPLFDTEGGLRLAWLPLDAEVFAGASPTVFLGIEDGTPRFAFAVRDWQETAAAHGFVDEEREAHPSLPDRFRFGDLRAVMGQLSPADAGDAAAAKGILGWHAVHGFCANCGAASEVADAGWRRTCPTCGAQHFPRTDPVVIMLILHGNSVLLGRQASWPPGMYSLLAGFMEPGESIEAAVRREVYEEAGVPVGQVDYLSSQPWPFPSSLMIGCRGVPLARDLHRDPAELEDVRWVSREDVVAALAGRDPDLRPARRGSIARFLIERWLADDLS